MLFRSFPLRDIPRNFTPTFQQMQQYCLWVTKRVVGVVAVFFYSLTSAQILSTPVTINLLQDSLSPSKNTSTWGSRASWVGAFHVGGYGTTLMILNNTWYKNYPRTSWHSFNDSREWLQMDKIGHAWSVYGLSRASSAAWKWRSEEHTSELQSH